MMKQLSLFALLLISLSHYCSAQDPKPVKRSLNIGIFSGVGGVNFSPIPGVDIHFRRNILRFAPGQNVMGGGYIREILKLSNTSNNWYWIGSVYAAQGKVKNRYPNAAGDPNIATISDYYKGILLTGLKVYLGSRLYSQVQLGAVYTKYHTSGRADEANTAPYFEFSLGINLLKSFRNPPAAN